MLRYEEIPNNVFDKTIHHLETLRDVKKMPWRYSLSLSLMAPFLTFTPTNRLRSGVG
jgi:hypothetical protein